MEPQEAWNRKEQALNGGHHRSLATPFRIIDQSGLQFANRVVPDPMVANTRKRARVEAALPTVAQSLTMLPQLQANPDSSHYSTGLQSTPDVKNLQCGTLNQTSPLGGQILHEQTSNKSSAPLRFLPHAMLGRVNHHADLLQDKIDALVRQKEEIFRQVYVERWQALFQTLEAEAERIILAKDEALVQLESRCMALENELARKSTESSSWKALAASEQSNSVRLRSLLARFVSVPAPAPAESCGSDSGPPAARDGVEDAESVQIGSEPALPGSCLVCRRRRATVLLLPCRCLSLCSDCQARGDTTPCPSCDGVVKGCINVVIH